MAKLKGTVKGDWDLRKPYEESFARQDQLLADLEKSGRVVKFPIADGYALYYVESLKPLVLSHIPYGDAYQIDGAYIRGLRASDLVLDRHKKFSCSCGKSDSRFDLECNFCGDIFTGG